MFDKEGPLENITFDEPIDEIDLEEVEDENDLCDCDPKHKEAQTVQKSAGATFGGFGGQVGDGTTVIVCTNCGERFYEDRENEYDGGYEPII